MYDKVCQKRRRCAPPFLSYSQKTHGGVQTPPSGARVNANFLIVPFLKFHQRCAQYMVEQRVRNNVNFTLVLHMLNFFTSTLPCLNSTLFCLSISSSSSVRSSVIICPKYLIQLVNVSGVDPILNVGTCTVGLIRMFPVHHVALRSRFGC